MEDACDWCIVCDKRLEPAPKASTSTAMARSSSAPIPTHPPLAPSSSVQFSEQDPARAKTTSNKARAAIKRNASGGRLVSNRSGARLVAMNNAGNKAKAAAAAAAQANKLVKPRPPRRLPDSDDESPKPVDPFDFSEDTGERPEWMSLYCSEACRAADETSARLRSLELDARARRLSSQLSGQSPSSYGSSNFGGRRSMDSGRQSSDSVSSLGYIRPITPMTPLSETRALPTPIVTPPLRPSLGSRSQSHHGAVAHPSFAGKVVPQHPSEKRLSADSSSGNRRLSFRGLESTSYGRSSSSLLAMSQIAQPVVSEGPDAVARGRLISDFNADGSRMRGRRHDSSSSIARFSGSPSSPPSSIRSSRSTAASSGHLSMDSDSLHASYGLYSSQRSHSHSQLFSHGRELASSPTYAAASTSTSVGTISAAFKSNGQQRVDAEHARSSSRNRADRRKSTQDVPFPSSTPSGTFLPRPSPLAGPRRNSSAVSVASSIYLPSSTRDRRESFNDESEDHDSSPPSTPNPAPMSSGERKGFSWATGQHYVPLYPVLDSEKLQRKREKGEQAAATLSAMAEREERNPNEPTLSRRKKLFYFNE